MAQNDDLWAGCGLHRHNWTDIAKAMGIVHSELTVGLEDQKIWMVRRALRWQESVTRALKAKIAAADKELEGKDDVDFNVELGKD